MIAPSTLIAVSSLLLLAWAMEGKNRRPILALPALLGVAIGIAGRMVGATELLGAAGGVFIDLGAGLVAAGLYLAVRDAQPRRFLVPGALSLLVGGLTLGVGAVFNQATSDSSSLDGHQDQHSTRLERLTGQFLVELGPDDKIEEIEPVLERFGASYERAFPSLTLAESEDLSQYYLVFDDEGDLDELRAALDSDIENVDATEWNVAVSMIPVIPSEHSALEFAKGLANDPETGRQWGLALTGANRVHEILSAAEPPRKAVVAIVDTGVDEQHEDLQQSFDASPGRGDRNGHGTHCAGIAGAATNNGIGIASLNWESRYVLVRSYKALGDNGGGSAESVAQAIIDAARDGADVISLSLGSFSPTAPRVEIKAVEYALEKGAIVVAAAGNASSDARQHAPANIEGVIAVSAVDSQNRKAGFSNTNTSLERPIAAPGVGVLSLKPGDQYVALNGTSMAAPFVAGLLGILRSLDPALDAGSAYSILHDTGVEGPDAAKIGRTIDAAAAVEQISSSRRRLVSAP